MVEEEPPKPMEEAENIKLVEGDPSKTTKVGKELQRSLKDELVKFLKQNLDVFAWSHEDMLRIDEQVIKHSINVDPMKKLIQKRRRVFALEWNKAIMEEVEKHLAVGFIGEVYYPEWHANVVMVKKSNGKWRIEANPKKVREILDMTSPKIVKEVQRLTGRVATLNKFVSKATDKCLPFFKTLK